MGTIARDPPWVLQSYLQSVSFAHDDNIELLVLIEREFAFAFFVFPDAATFRIAHDDLQEKRLQCWPCWKVENEPTLSEKRGLKWNAMSCPAYKLISNRLWSRSGTPVMNSFLPGPK